jgi:HTH-type transcriptional regulator/antitoxin HigA
MSLTAEEFDVKRYGRLLARALPRVIRNEVENERALAVVESLMAKGEDHRTAEEDALLELLADLIHSYEESTYPIPHSAPHEMVAFLLDQRGLTAQDLVPVVGSRSRVSEILAAKRSISKEQAKKLAAFFKVGLEAFI